MAVSAHGAWAPGPTGPSLADGSVHVWLADLQDVSDDLCVALSADERARGERFLRERNGRLWQRSRALLRTLLGRYLHRDPGALRFRIGAYGKPELIDHTALSFNLSHSRHTALYAFATPGPVGIDVEGPRRAFDAVAIAARELGSDEAQRLRALPPTEREREFLRAWVRHEAKLKCLGLGLGAADRRPDTSFLWIDELQPGPDAVAALAAPERPSDLRCWQWPAHPGAGPDNPARDPS
jgi:4'-phosphopantetheinyl transferase